MGSDVDAINPNWISDVAKFTEVVFSCKSSSPLSQQLSQFIFAYSFA